MAIEKKVTLDRERTLRGDMFAEMQFEKFRGKDVSETDWGSSTDIVCRVWSMLLHEDDSLTPEDVGRMLTADTIEGTLAALKEIINPEGDPLAGTETSGGPSDDTTSDSAIPTIGD